MKKGILIFLGLVVVVGGSVFLGLRYMEQQRIDARAAIDRSLSSMDRVKDDFDEIKGMANPITVKKVNDLYTQILPKLDQAEKAFLDKRYSEAISLADEALVLTNEAKGQFDRVGSPYTGQQKIDARAAIDEASVLLNKTKEGVDAIGAKGALTTGTMVEINKFSDILSQAISKHDQAEKAFADTKYSEAIGLAKESIRLVVEFKGRIDSLGMER